MLQYSDIIFQKVRQKFSLLWSLLLFIDLKLNIKIRLYNERKLKISYTFNQYNSFEN